MRSAFAITFILMVAVFCKAQNNNGAEFRYIDKYGNNVLVSAPALSQFPDSLFFRDQVSFGKTDSNIISISYAIHELKPIKKSPVFKWHYHYPVKVFEVTVFSVSKPSNSNIDIGLLHSGYSTWFMVVRIGPGHQHLSYFECNSLWV
jgi:hypothetical protein